MAEYELKLRGWQGLVLGAFLLFVIVLRFSSMSDATSDKALMEKLTLQLQTEYFPDQVDKLKAVMAQNNRDEISKVSGSILSTKLNLLSVKTSSPLFSFSTNQKVIVKVEFTVDDDSGTFHSGTRYYRFRHGSIGNSWSYEYSSNIVSYYLNFL